MTSALSASFYGCFPLPVHLSSNSVEPILRHLLRWNNCIKIVLLPLFVFPPLSSCYEMEADIPTPNIRVFARALTTLSKIGDVLIVETAPDRLLIRALSQAQSVYAQISFAPSFFTRYSIALLAAVAADDSADFSFRTRPPSAFSTTGSYPSPSPSPSAAAAQRPHQVIVNSKACLTPFRGAVSMIKRLTIRLTTEDDCGYSELSTQHSEQAQWQQQQQLQSSQRGRRKRGRGGDGDGGVGGTGDVSVAKDLCLMVQLHLDDLGVTKTYRIPTSEQSNILQPDFSRQSCPTVLSAKASKFQSWLTNFQAESATSYTTQHNTVCGALMVTVPCCPLTSWHFLSSCLCAVWRS